MEDSFRVRVDRIFGSLSSSATVPSLSSPTPLKPLWCLSDEELEKREWNRDKGSPETEPAPFPSHLDGFFANRRAGPEKDSKDLYEELEDDFRDLGDADDGNDDDELFSRAQSRRRDGSGTADEDVWEIRSLIGLDCTLDNEEEEDDYDKVAVGMENSTDRLYMNGVNDQGGIYPDSYKALPVSCKVVTRDPRANHFAASSRLIEDAEAATMEDADAAKPSHSLHVSVGDAPVAEDNKVRACNNGAKLKPILKRKETQKCAKSDKRVRFDPGCQHNSVEDKVKAAEMETSSIEDASSTDVPDYVRNPSKYTYYSLEFATEVDEESNEQAYLDFLRQLKKSGGDESQSTGACFELPKSVAFPLNRMKNDSAIVKEGDASVLQALPISIAEDGGREDEACVMDEDDPGTGVDEGSGTRKAARQYRRKDEHARQLASIEGKTSLRWIE